MDGSLCLYTYEDTSTDSDGNRQTTYVHYTIAMTQLPQTAALMQELYCQRRFGFRFMDSAEDVFRRASGSSTNPRPSTRSSRSSWGPTTT